MQNIHQVIFKSISENKILKTTTLTLEVTTVSHLMENGKTNHLENKLRQQNTFLEIQYMQGLERPL